MKSAAPSDPVSDPPAGAASVPAEGLAAEQLSAWLDGELDSQAAQPLLQALLQSGTGRSQFDAWCLVGDALRSQEVAAGHSPRLCARIAQAIDAEPALLAPQALAAPKHRSSAMARHIASGAAIAAAAAVVVLVALPQLRGTGGAAPAQLAQGRTAATPVSEAPAVVLAIPASGGSRNPRLDPYIQAHRDFSGAGVMPAAAVYLRFGNEGDR